MEDILRGLLGIVVMLLVLYGLSANRKAIDWKLVVLALGLQIVFGMAVLYVPFVRSGFDAIGWGFVQILNFTKSGSTFVFGGLMEPSNIGFIFAFQILPTIIFFSALSSILYYLGILQRLIYGIAYVLTRFLRLSGAESLAAAANVFIGQTEAPLIVKPYLDKMTKSELMCLMVGGMATIAGGVLAAFIGFLGGDDPAVQQEFARHLLTASIMSAPAAILAAKMLYPETETIDTNLDIPKDKIGDNLLEAISNGTGDGLKLAVNVGAMLIVFVALVEMLNVICEGTLGEWIGWSMADNSLSFFQNNFPANMDFITTSQNPLPPLEELTKVVQETIVTGSAGQDSIVFAIVEQSVSIAQFEAVYDTMSYNSLSAVWTPEHWNLQDENANIVGQLAFESKEIERMTLNMYISQLTEGRFSGFNLEYILGLLMSPIAWILGTPSQDILIVGQLLGKKTMLNEFVAYADIPAVQDSLTYKGKVIATYALCGFANFASIGIQLGGIGAIAPERRTTLAEFGVKALIGGTIACFLTAIIAGVLI
ncbi:MAG: NupC/NupG family nucleoside CNT transporter [Aureispira sp.]